MVGEVVMVLVVEVGPQGVALAHVLTPRRLLLLLLEDRVVAIRGW